MKAQIKDLRESQVEENEEEVKSDFDLEREEYERLLEEKEKPFREMIEYIEASPSMSLDFTTATGEPNGQLNVDTLMNWQDNHTNIYMSTIGDEPIIYVWRVLRRFEYLLTLGDSTKSATTDWSNDSQRERFVIDKCLLFPNPSTHFKNNSPVGVIPTLTKQILHKSGFVSDAEALNSINVVG